ncbi:MAG TPA: glutamyl-tRNA reductase [Pseudobacteroides sp.]|uniref:glutamyl-tRNA reductase n=1 Tax=Pseudobacteroides sp. TaxID=1968840 RepID=UPI002F92BFD0
MNLLVVGVNYRKTPVEIREKLNFSIDEQKNALREIVSMDGIMECIILSTCNRTEVYVFHQYPHYDSSILEKKLCSLKGLNIYNLKKYIYVYSSIKAVRHLFKVASGLDSMVLGEDQILRQVKDAYDLSLEVGSSSGMLNTLFREGITAAKKVKTFTEISKTSVSVGTHAVRLIEREFGYNLDKMSALIIGAGKIGGITLKNLISKGVGKIYITSRSCGKVQDISKLYENVTVIDYSMRYSIIENCEIVISSTASPHYTITKELLESALETYKKRIFIDLAVPRDIDLAIEELPSISCFNIDHLMIEVNKNLYYKLSEVSKAEEIINQYVNEFEHWYYFREALPVVREVQRFADEVLNEKTEYLISRLTIVNDEERQLVKGVIKSTVSEILNKLLYSVRDNSSKEDMQAYFRCLKEVMKES